MTVEHSLFKAGALGAMWSVDRFLRQIQSVVNLVDLNQSIKSYTIVWPQWRQHEKGAKQTGHNEHTVLGSNPVST